MLPGVIVPAPEGGREVRAPDPLPPMPAEAPVWSAIPPDLASVQTLAVALGVNGRVTATADGFTVTGGAASLSVKPANGVPGWRFEMGQCPAGRCRPPDVRAAVPVPSVEARDGPDHPPFDAAPVAGEAARRIATVVGNVAVAHWQMSVAEWWAQFSWLAGDVPVRSGFTAYIQPDGSVRTAHGFLDRPGAPGPPRPLVGVEEGLRGLAAPAQGIANLSRWIGGRPPPLVVTGVRLGWSLEPEGFVPNYVFTLDDGGARYISAL